MITRYKCHQCYTILSEEDVVDNKCPICGNKRLEKMCPLDHLCTCGKDIHEGVHYCPSCGEPVCECGSHDVGVISRVTGYLSDVKGWNAAKKQELIDRKRVTV